jgi:hypothetical protein
VREVWDVCSQRPHANTNTNIKPKRLPARSGPNLESDYPGSNNQWSLVNYLISLSVIWISSSEE